MPLQMPKREEDILEVQVLIGQIWKLYNRMKSTLIIKLMISRLVKFWFRNVIMEIINIVVEMEMVEEEVILKLREVEEVLSLKELMLNKVIELALVSIVTLDFAFTLLELVFYRVLPTRFSTPHLLLSFIFSTVNLALDSFFFPFMRNTLSFL